MNWRNLRSGIALICTLMLVSGCESAKSVDVLIIKGTLYDGDGGPPVKMDVALCGDSICAISPPGQQLYEAKQVVDASYRIVAPGFIDPHTHSMADLKSEDNNANLNYLTQGVTTVVNGNDGGGPYELPQSATAINPRGIGTNLALFTGHGTLRREAMGLVQRQASEQELAHMQQLLRGAMEQGSLGLSSGLYYVPGAYADSAEVTALAKVAAEYNGIYDTHLRDESSFTVGFLPAVQEAIDIATGAGIHLHLAHIKALGVDVWGQSQQAIAMVEQAQQQGVNITADQYPWQASGTNLRNAVVPKWLMADSKQAFHQRLDDATLQSRISAEIIENIRRRGGPDSLLLTETSNPEWLGKTLGDIATANQQDLVSMVKIMVKAGTNRVASFNMDADDMANFVRQPWVVTSSDGTNGHPRKYASFPKKYRDYVVDKQILSMSEFIHRSSGKTAEILGLADRGFIREGHKADIQIIDLATYQPNADFSQWNKLSSGVDYLWINGEMVIEAGIYNGALPGELLRRQP